MSGYGFFTKHKKSFIILFCGLMSLGLARSEFLYAWPGDIPRLEPESLSGLISEQGAGKVVVITVFASWCPPCREEFPLLVKLRNEAAEKDLFMAGISADEHMFELRAFLIRQSVNFPIYTGSPQVFRIMGVGPIPHLFVFDRKGVLRESLIGSPSEAVLRGILEQLLGEKNG
ncbi:MAG: TlpA family protein disulfide reductase [Deltaproteobacteria bacterium]|jgi:thiol-disulfide isomerase/thioredoxin|nr:TlpA family protein disulfide reductase [Deltaproteobacteria bacterium]